MSATRNDITGDVIASKVRGAEDMDAYRSNWDRIFGKKDEKIEGVQRWNSACPHCGWTNSEDRAAVPKDWVCGSCGTLYRLR